MDQIQLDNIMSRLASLGNESNCKRYAKNQEPEPYFGVTMGDLTKLSKEFKAYSEDWMTLWETNNLDAQILAVYLMNPKKIDESQLKSILQTENVSVLVWDKLVDKVLTKVKEPEKWLDYLTPLKADYQQRLAWGIKIRFVIGKKYTDSEAKEMLDYIKTHLKQAEETVKWVMNRCLVEIALNYPTLYDDAYQSAEQMGVYKDTMVSKGCTSPYAPDWINAVMKKR